MAVAKSNSDKHPVLAILLPLIILLLFYWSIYLAPRRVTTDSQRLSSERSRQILEESRSDLQAGKLTESLQLTRELHDNYPSNHIYIDQLATLYHRLNRFKEEAAILEDYLKYAPIPGEACPRLGEAYLRQGLLKENLSACQRCLALEPKNLDDLFFLAHAYELVGDLSQARNLYQRGVDSDSNYLDMSLGLARIDLQQGDSAKAGARAREVLTRMPDNVDAMLVMAMVMRKEHDLNAAKRYLIAGIRLVPNYLDLYLMLGDIAEAERQFDVALSYYQHALEIDPTNREAISRKANLTNNHLTN